LAEVPEPDLLSLLLRRISLRGRVYARPTVCGEWQLDPSGHARTTYHLVGRGQCWLHMREAAPVALRSGDLVFFPEDAWHVLSASPQLQQRPPVAPDPGEGPYTQLICGLYQADDRDLQHLLRGLPPVVLVRSEEGGARLSHLLRLLGEESEQESPGTQVVLDALSDILLALVLRHCVAHGLIARGLLAGLRDPRLAEALFAMHSEPGRAWRLESLAERAALSRSTFAERFQRVLGSSPAHYLAELRMQEASARLRSSHASVAQIAEQLGYATEAAFRRAFRRITGRTPGDVRRDAERIAVAV
jgi:AraC family transcriptional regulator, activator of mtrCDE